MAAFFVSFGKYYVKADGNKHHEHSSWNLYYWRFDDNSPCMLLASSTKNL